MSGFSLAILSLALIWGLAFYRAPLIVWTAAVALYLFSFQWIGWLSWYGLIAWPLFFIVAVPLIVPGFRHHITQQIFEWFRGVLPAMSETEKAAIEAGDVWWEKELFQGKPDWQQLLNMPKSSLTQEEQSFLDNQVETLCTMLNDWKIVHELNDLPSEVWDFLKKEKFFGMIIPKTYGGLEFSALAHSTIIMKIATRSISAAVTAMVPNSLGPAELLLHYGTQEQKDHYLPRLANGTDIPCFALTGPEAGSDAGAIPDKGVVCKGHYDGKEVIGIRLTCDKRYITLAPIATVIGIAFKLYDPDHLISEKKEIGITLCLVPRNHPGLEIGSRHFPLNMAFMNGPIRANEIFIPIDWIIGGVEMAGQGWRMLMECLSAGRGISLPALSTATGALAYRMTGAYSAIRRQFNVPIGAFEGVEEALARIAGFTYLLQASRIFTAGAIDQGRKPGVATAIAKFHMTEMSRKIMNDAMDVHGGRGIMLGPFNYLARGYQAIPVSITVEGANILTRSLMIFGQGAIRCHPYAKEEIQTVELYERNQEQALRKFDEYCLKHAGYFISNFARCLLFSLTRGLISKVSVNDVTKPYVKKLNWLSSALAMSSDVALFTLGGDLKRKEKISARLGDVLSQLYLASAVLKYYHDQNKPYNDWPVVEWALQTCLFSAQEAFYGFFDNLPMRYVGKLLKYLIFPFGKAFELPKDSLGQKVARLMLVPNETRSRLTDICYIGKDLNDPTGLIEIAFRKLIEAQVPISKIMQAVKSKEINKNLSFEQQIQAAFNLKIIDENEALILKEFEASRKKVIAVDEFKPDYALGTQALCKKEVIKVQTG